MVKPASRNKALVTATVDIEISDAIHELADSTDVPMSRIVNVILRNWLHNTPVPTHFQHRASA